MTSQTGFILIDKPSGITSFDVIFKMRKITGIKKIGHAGTLDPMASGLLILAIGREATREISKFVKLNKIYSAELTLGSVSDTYDKEGKIEKYSDIIPPVDDVKEVLNSFIGKQKQVPPMFSAKKVGGKKLYELARQGIEIERQPQDIEIFDIKLIEYCYPVIKIEVKCSSGTYIRSLAKDIGEKLKTGALLSGLVRTQIGEFNLKNAVKLGELNKENWNNFLFDNSLN